MGFNLTSGCVFPALSVPLAAKLYVGCENVFRIARMVYDLLYHHVKYRVW